MPFGSIGLSHAEAKRELIIQPRVREVKITASVKTIH
jgi:hypothetical protein